MVTKEQLKKAENKYAGFVVNSREVDYYNKNFNSLMEFIGQNYNMGRCTAVGNAYAVIRQYTDRALGVNTKKKCKLKTSKQEIKSIRKCFGFECKKEYTMRIPYKISYIFKAINEIMNELQKKGICINEELKEFVDRCYSESFYSDYIKTYNDNYDEIEQDSISEEVCECVPELYNDLNSPKSPLNQKMDWRDK
ncbi:MAG: hypothetical protein II820_05250 [Ruminiclostridium sp.]|nr:hypothetical protein [Ruminiclostridium sp.]